MGVLHVDRRDAALAYRDGAVEVRVPGAPASLTPIGSLDRIVVTGSAIVSTGLLAQCWERGVGFLVLSGRRGMPTARLAAAPHGDAGLRLAQALATQDPLLRRRLAALIVSAKITGQAGVLRRLSAGRPGGRALSASAMTTIARARRRIRLDQSLGVDSLRGIEGAVAAAYFPALAAFFPPSLGFSRRVRRPPTDPVNAALSLGYAMATAEASRQAQIAGLDPAIGALHGLAHGREALALDLVELARPRVDRFVHDLFRTRTLTADHFTRSGDAMLLGKAGRARFHAAWEDEAPALARLLRRTARVGIGMLRAMPQEAMVAKIDEAADDP